MNLRGNPGSFMGRKAELKRMNFKLEPQKRGFLIEEAV
jgi:hypothetical protein